MSSPVDLYRVFGYTVLLVIPLMAYIALET